MKEKKKNLVIIPTVFLIILIILFAVMYGNFKAKNDLYTGIIATRKIYILQEVVLEKKETVLLPEINDEYESINVLESTETIETSSEYLETSDDTECSFKIIIETDKKTRTFDVMDNVDERTLKHDLGHLPSSVLPGQEGFCVVMGHRDTQFSILKHCEIGDEILVEYNGRTYKYEITDIVIVEDDSSIKFKVIDGKYLALVSCYPFYYTGHAPRKIIFYATLKCIS